MKNKIKYLISIIIIGSLVFPRPVLGFIGTGIFDYFETALGGIEELSQPVTRQIIIIFFSYIVSLVFLHTSASLLQFVTENPQWLSITTNEMVRSGWYFTAGIANMFIILFLIVIALAFILKAETFQAKKALPRLLLVAFLINFSLVFVGIVVDIANVFYNTLLSGNEGLPSEIINSLGMGMGRESGTINNLTSWIIALSISFVLPFVAPFAQYALVLGLIVSSLPQILTWIFQIFCAFLIGGVFFLLTFVFAIRIFIIQLLAMVAPLAFLCFILPQTRKYWNQWLNYLVEWASFGIMLFFFLVLGLRATSWLAPSYGTFPPPAFGWLQVKEYFVYYFFLFVYLVTAWHISKKTMPTMAGAIISQAQSLGGIMWTRGVRPVGSTAWQGLQEAAFKQRELEERKKRGEKLTRREELGRRLGMVTATPMRWGYRRLRGVPLEMAVEKDIEKKTAEFEKRFGKNIDKALEVSRPERMVSPRDKAAMGLYLAKMKGAKGLSELSEKELQEVTRATATQAPTKLEDIVKHTPKLIKDEKVGRLIQDTMVKKGMEDKDIEEMREKKVTIEGENIEELVKTKEGQRKIIREAAYKKAVGALKDKDVETLADETLRDKKFREMIARYKHWSFIRKLGTERGVDIEELQDQVEKEIGLKEIAKTNPHLVRAPTTSGGELLMRKWKDPTTGTEMRKRKAQEFIAEARKEMKEKPPLSTEEISNMLPNLPIAEEEKLKKAKQALEAETGRLTELEESDSQAQDNLRRTITRMRREMQPEEYIQEVEDELSKILKRKEETVRDKQSAIQALEKIEEEITTREETKEAMEKPAPLPEIKRVRGRIPQAVREPYEEGEKLHSEIAKGRTQLKLLDGEIKKLTEELSSLREEHEKFEKGEIELSTKELQRINKDIKEKEEGLEKKKDVAKERRESIKETKTKLAATRHELEGWIERQKAERVRRVREESSGE